MKLPALRHPLSPIQRIKRQVRRISTYLARKLRDQDYKTMLWLVGRYQGSKEIIRVFFIIAGAPIGHGTQPYCGACALRALPGRERSRGAGNVP
jgi:hypothetical protein